jgi:hypothetical protein
MAGLLIEGVGIIVSATSLGYVVDELGSNGNNAIQLYTNFFHTLEAGIIVAGVGVMVLGIGLFVASRQT